MRTILIAVLLLAAGAFLIVGCEQAVSPGSEQLPQYDARMFGDVTWDTLYFHSGNGTCGGADTLVLLRDSITMDPLGRALIGGGSDSAECSCDSIALLLPGTLPVTTMLPTDSLGWFDIHFELPVYFRDVLLGLSVLADDGAEILVNDIPVGTVDLFGGAVPPAAAVSEMTVTGDSLFVEGTNTLSFRVANTGTGYFGEATGRADTVDCMYLAFEAELEYAVEEPCEVVIDVKPGSDENPVNCKSMNGVIPVALLTTDCFDVEIVDHTTVTFGPAGAFEAHSNKHGMKRHVEDVDGDGDMDLVFHFRGYETGIACGDTIVTLRGMTWDGLEFEAVDHIRAVPWGECDGDSSSVDPD